MLRQGPTAQGQDCGYARGNTTSGIPRNYADESARAAVKKRAGLQGVDIRHCSYSDLEIPDASIIYCDPPYAGVTKYEYPIDHNNFWAWCREKVDEGHNVFISEYNAPDEFVCVWEQKLRVCVKPGIGKQAIEKLFIHKSQL